MQECGEAAGQQTLKCTERSLQKSPTLLILRDMTKPRPSDTFFPSLILLA